MSYGFKLVYIIIPKDDNQPLLKTNLSLAFYYNKSNGLVTRFVDYTSGKDMTQVMNTRPGYIMSYDSASNKLSNFYFYYVKSQTEEIMPEVFGYLKYKNASRVVWIISCLILILFR